MQKLDGVEESSDSNDESIDIENWQQSLAQCKSNSKSSWKLIVALILIATVIGVVLFKVSPSEIAIPIPITFIWIGQKFPVSYMCGLSTRDFPYKVILNPTIKKQFSRPLKLIQKADLARLEYLYEYGGIYSDFDNSINFQCLMGVLKYKEGLIFTDEATDIRNSFIYASSPGNRQLKQILDSVNEENSLQYFAGCPLLINASVVNIRSCVKHGRDWSWRDETDGKDQKYTYDWNTKVQCEVIGNIKPAMNQLQPKTVK